MLDFVGVKFWAIVAGCLLVAGLVFLGYHHYTGLVETVAEQKAEVAKLETQLKQERANVQEAVRVNQAWADEARRTRKTLEELTQVQEDASAATRRLNDALSRIDFRRLSLEAPGPLEDRINAGTERARILLEHATRGTSPVGQSVPTPKDRPPSP